MALNSRNIAQVHGDWYPAEDDQYRQELLTIAAQHVKSPAVSVGLGRRTWIPVRLVTMLSGGKSAVAVCLPEHLAFKVIDII